MRLLKRLLRSTSGSSAAEFAIVLPLFLILFLGMIDAGRFLWQYNLAEKASQVGARTAIVTNVLSSGLKDEDYTGQTIDGVKILPGGAIPADALGTMVCTSSGCTCDTTKGAVAPCPDPGTFDSDTFNNVLLARMQAIDPAIGFQAFQARKIAFRLGLDTKFINPAVKFMLALYKAYEDTDSSLFEINPFITTTDGRVFALDAKVNFDDNALFRHPDLRDLRDITEEDALEVEASKYGLNYIKLDGNVGCMVNGAGLAMATMDIIKFAGGMPANFLDVGGGANAEQVTHAFEILLSDKHVKAVLINIFGGILRVDTLATGVVQAARQTNIQLPIVLRLEGTNVEKGREILKESGLNFIVAETMKDAAEKVVAAAGGRK